MNLLPSSLSPAYIRGVPIFRLLRGTRCLSSSVISPLVSHKHIHIGPGMMGEIITIEVLAVMQLAVGTRLAIGSAVVEVTKRRSPCYQLNGIDPRLLKAVVTKRDGQAIFKAGIMARILQGGWVRAGDLVKVLSPADLTL